MKKILILFWPEEGNVERVAEKFISQLPNFDVKKISITRVTKELLAEADYCILGGSTVGVHVWEDADDSNKWNSFFRLIDETDMTHKSVAFYGLGNQVLYPDHFVDNLGVFQEEFEKRNVNILGQWPTKGYNFTNSEGVNDNRFYGLALDEDQQAELTDERIKKWLELVLEMS